MNNTQDQKNDQTIKISFLGDLCLNGNYINYFQKGINPFSFVSNKLASSDFVIANLECLTSGKTGSNPLKSIKLYTSEETLGFLKQLNVGMVTLANNHVYDNLLDGFESTTTFLQHNNISHIGAWKSNSTPRKSHLYEKNGIRVLFLNYLHPDTNPNLPVDSTLSISVYNHEHIINEIQEGRKNSDYIVLLLHWGGKVEGGLYPDRYQPLDSRAFIKCGADLVIGHHSHTWQPYEIINDKYVFYSIGDFCSDSVYKTGRRFRVRSTSGIVHVSFTKECYKINIDFFKKDGLFLKEDNRFIKRIKFRNSFFKILKKQPFHYGYTFYLRIIEPVLYYFFGNQRNFFKKLKQINITKIKEFYKRINSRT